MDSTAQFDSVAGKERLTATRQSLHWVAEWLLAGPQHREKGTIRLDVVPGGFARLDRAVTVEGDILALPDGRRVTLLGRLGEVAREAGIVASAPESLYPDSSGGSTESELQVDPEAAVALGHWFGRGSAALRAFAPDQTPVLWPEHFDLGITVDEVNYGVSPGDAHIDVPYAYIGPWTPRTGPFWNASFGAVRTWDQLLSENDMQAFFAEGRAAAT